MPNILIVDNQPCVRQLLSHELICEGYGVATAGNAKSARGHLKCSQPDLVLLDLCLDGFDGFGLLKDIKAQDPDLPVIMVTAYSNFADDPRLFQADAYVVKSLDFMELKQTITDVLGRKARLQGNVQSRLCFPKLRGANYLL
jgi:DNA-binding NtrC family response regulator